ncbi:Phytosulfokine receptor 1 [Raphanus sativus]|uniref:non-specific serine/threonine protein kinase n=1 Tax=Raphanus sativus TaxID=3726 RepID=A0A6J0NKR4_RAPSA|nr:phytosulfokine receptor 1 [Raphanus sativus]KAJ4901247.1 Phytosulfokine receptor 1 [Raphanus sativus]
MRVWVVVIVLTELLLCFLWASESQTLLTCHPRDLEALRDFISNLKPKPDDWSINDDCCNWTGVTCNNNNNNNNSSRVTKLELGNKKLSGKLSESLGALDQITVLNLSRNFIRDSIPLSIFNLTTLQTLDLSSNDLSGEIPPNTVNLPSLQSLDLSSNKLNGSLPSHLCLSSPRIRVIKLAVNYFAGDFPPGLGDCLLLEHLCLGMNNLTGIIPRDLFRLQRLNLLGLQENRLSGPLSPEIGNLSALVRLDVSTNHFSGSIPDVFGEMTRLKELLAQSNRFTGGIPSSLSNSPSLNLLNLRNNSLTGLLRLNCTAMVGLNSLDLGTNRFNGRLPENLPVCKRLKNVNLARNSFGGQVPESYKDFQSLSFFSLSNSSLSNISSALRILQSCKNLTTLVLTLNFHGEALPPDGDATPLRFEKLKVLVVANCKLTGSIPRWLSSSNDLQLLDLSWNRLTGAIPSWIGDFKDLFYLDLSNNSFTGEIPKSLTKLQSLTSRNISLDEPSPDFPFFMKRNESARGLQYNQIVGFPPTIELGHNNLSGPIWEEFGNLKKIHVFDLKWNSLSGSIPSSLSGMTSLEVLDLSNNRLSGSIPSSLQKLTFLSKFSVASNNLSGRIPSGGQFQTFPNSSFEFNDLCGEHRLPCSGDEVNGTTTLIMHSRRRRSRGAEIGMAVGIAFGSVFLLTLLTLVVLHARRRSVEVDPEMEEENMNIKEVEEMGSKLVVLFRNNNNDKEDLSFDDILDSTNNFDQANIIGCGGFGLVYKAVLPDGSRVAIKRLSGDCGQIEREFKAEVETLSRAQHPNLVLLQGFCFYKTDRLLIYSYMENGSLDYWLHERNDGPALLGWKTRLRIAQGAARGLFYLHEACDPHILHRDIKSSNILLDENFDSHLADFGLARLMSPYDTHVSTDLVGTLGYIPPEYGQASVATFKGDVYSFGVVLLELLTDKRPVDMCKPKGGRDLISWVVRMKSEGRASEVFDPFIHGKEIEEEEMFRVLEVACLCLSHNPKQRPTTEQLVSWLDDV